MERGRPPFINVSIGAGNTKYFPKRGHASESDSGRNLPSLPKLRQLFWAGGDVSIVILHPGHPYFAVLMKAWLLKVNFEKIKTQTTSTEDHEGLSQASCGDFRSDWCCIGASLIQ